MAFQWGINKINGRAPHSRLICDYKWGRGVCEIRFSYLLRELFNPILWSRCGFYKMELKYKYLNRFLVLLHFSNSIHPL